MSEYTDLSSEEFKSRVKQGQEIDTDNTIVRKLGGGRKQIKFIDEDQRTIGFTISTQAVDRDGDTIVVEGWSTENFENNPVVLWAHDSRSLPIAKAVQLNQTKKSLDAIAEFTTREDNPMGDTVFHMFSKGFLSATSVGFRPLEWAFVEEDEDGTPRGPFAMDFKRQELLEFSAVPVPSNPEALIQARAKGIDTEPLVEWIEQALDSDNDGNEIKLFIPRSKLEKLWENAKTKQGTIFSLSPDKQKELRQQNLKSIEKQNKEDCPEENLDNVPVKDKDNVDMEELKLDSTEFSAKQLIFPKSEWTSVESVKNWIQSDKAPEGINGIELSDDDIVSKEHFDTNVFVVTLDKEFEGKTESVQEIEGIVEHEGEPKSVKVIGDPVSEAGEEKQDTEDSLMKHIKDIIDEEQEKENQENVSLVSILTSHLNQESLKEFEEVVENRKKELEMGSEENEPGKSNEDEQEKETLDFFELKEVLQEVRDLLSVMTTKEITLIEPENKVSEENGSEEEEKDESFENNDETSGSDNEEKELDLDDFSYDDLKKMIENSIEEKIE